MVTKEQVKQAEEAWRVAAGKALLEYENWGIFMRARFAFIDSQIKNGSTYKQAEQEVQMYSDAHAKAHLDAYNAMAERSREYLEVLREYEKSLGLA